MIITIKELIFYEAIYIIASIILFKLNIFTRGFLLNKTLEIQALLEIIKNESPDKRNKKNAR